MNTVPEDFKRRGRCDDDAGVRPWRLRPRRRLVVESDDASRSPTRGIATVAVALPSCGETGDTLGDLYDDVRACQEAIAEVDGPVVLCGHSYGGMIITEAGADDRVTHLLYVTLGDARRRTVAVRSHRLRAGAVAAAGRRRHRSASIPT